MGALYGGQAAEEGGGVIIDRFERLFERAIEGGVASLFRLRVQPAEIARRLERALLDGRQTSVGTTLAPNVYEVRLHPDDAAAFADWHDALCHEMEGWLAELAFARGVSTVGPVRVRIVEDDQVPRRAVRAIGHFDAAPAVARSPRRGGPGLRLIPADPELEGAALRGERITVGRAPGNALVIPRRDVSRHHALLERGDRGWRARDLESRNGTWVNGERVDEARLARGDVIAFGAVAFTLHPDD